MTGGWVLDLMPQEMAMCRLRAGGKIPLWTLEAGFFCLARTPGELSLLCPAELVPPEVERNPGWRALVVRGPLDFSEVGVMSALSGALAQAGVSILAFSTHDTDCLLVKEENLDQARTALAEIGCRVEAPADPPRPLDSPQASL